MIAEQAFYALPEFLVGTGFTRYEMEGTLVMAYAMALLQELNGRNVANPIALVYGQNRYPGLPNRTADLFLSYEAVGVLSTDLACYGVRPQLWIEAKFFRKNKHGFRTGDPVVNALLLLADLIRLSVFPSTAQTNSPTGNGRYLLHAYEGTPEDHLAMTRNVGGTKRAPRAWLQPLLSVGSHPFDIGDLSKERKAFDNNVGVAMRNLKFTGRLTTLAIVPPTGKYCMYLNRIDECDVTLHANRLELRSDDTEVQTPSACFSQLRADIDRAMR